MRWFDDRGRRHATEPHQGDHGARRGTAAPGTARAQGPRPKGGPPAPYQMEAAKGATPTSHSRAASTGRRGSSAHTSRLGWPPALLHPNRRRHIHHRQRTKECGAGHPVHAADASPSRRAAAAEATTARRWPRPAGQAETRRGAATSTKNQRRQHNQPAAATGPADAKSASDFLRLAPDITAPSSNLRWQSPKAPEKESKWTSVAPAPKQPACRRQKQPGRRHCEKQRASRLRPRPARRHSEAPARRHKRQTAAATSHADAGGTTRKLRNSRRERPRGARRAATEHPTSKRRRKKRP